MVLLQSWHKLFLITVALLMVGGVTSAQGAMSRGPGCVSASPYAKPDQSLTISLGSAQSRDIAQRLDFGHDQIIPLDQSSSITPRRFHKIRGADLSQGLWNLLSSAKTAMIPFELISPLALVENMPGLDSNKLAGEMWMKLRRQAGTSPQCQSLSNHLLPIQANSPPVV